MKIFLINGAKKFAESDGRYNAALHDAARQQLDELGHALQETRIESGYVIENELQKYLWADVVIYQMPGWWMGVPWTVKKYIDEVLSEGKGTLYANDGRSTANPDKNYGRGGLLQGRSYMLSLTWNAPRAAFDDPEEFFEGRGVDGVYFPFHKSQQFIGMSALPTFLAADIVKSPNIERDVMAYREHLTRILGINKPDVAVDGETEVPP